MTGVDDRAAPVTNAAAQRARAATVPRALQVAAALGWRVLVVAGALFVVGMVVSFLAPVVVSVAIALLLAALLDPVVNALVARRVPRGPATALVVVGSVAILGSVLTLVVITFVNGAPQLGAQLQASVTGISRWLTDGPLGIKPEQLGDIPQQLLSALNVDQSPLAARALTTAGAVAGILSATVLTIFTLIFFLYGGQQIWTFLLQAVPAAVRRRSDVAGRRALAALVSYTRATLVVACVDAVGIGIGVALLGLPLVLPLAVLVLLGAFVPIVGAVVAGGVAVLVALAVQGVGSALVVLAIVVAVMQLESHVLQPLLLGRAVKLHPLAVVLAVAAGLLVGGIAGALLAVPLLAVLNSAVRSLRSPADRRVDPQEVHTSEPAESGPDEAGIERQPEL